MNESEFKTKVLKKLRGIPRSWWTKIQQVSIRGTPDIIGCLNSFFVALELKRTEKARREPLQMENLQWIEEAGGYSAVVYPENLEEILEELWTLSMAEH